jgi:hypothetical protein
MIVSLPGKAGQKTSCPIKHDVVFHPYGIADSKKPTVRSGYVAAFEGAQFNGMEAGCVGSS